MELGLITFADMEPESLPGRAINAHQRIKDLMEEIQLADQLGFDVFGVGEHHRPDYAVSSPAIILGAAAAVTKNIKLCQCSNRAKLRRSGSRVPGFFNGRSFIRWSCRNNGGARIFYRIVSFVRLRSGRL